jgi:hypothetical protein
LTSKNLNDNINNVRVSRDQASLNLKMITVITRPTTNKETEEELFNLEALKTASMMVDGNVIT